MIKISNPFLQDVGPGLQVTTWAITVFNLMGNRRVAAQSKKYWNNGIGDSYKNKRDTLAVSLRFYVVGEPETGFLSLKCNYLHPLMMHLQHTHTEKTIEIHLSHSVPLKV